MTGEIPRLFFIAAGHPVPQLAAEPLADGVVWPDGTISVHWASGTCSTWAGFDDPNAATVHSGEVTVVWRRQDTYADPEVV